MDKGQAQESVYKHKQLLPSTAYPKITLALSKREILEFPQTIVMLPLADFAHLGQASINQLENQAWINKSLFSFCRLETIPLESSIVYIFIGQQRRPLTKQMDENIVW